MVLIWGQALIRKITVFKMKLKLFALRLRKHKRSTELSRLWNFSSTKFVKPIWQDRPGHHLRLSPFWTFDTDYTKNEVFHEGFPNPQFAFKVRVLNLREMLFFLFKKNRNSIALQNILILLLFSKMTFKSEFLRVFRTLSII